MSEPKTLLQMAGVDAKASTLSDATLIIIDAQREYLDGGLPLVGMGSALEALSQLLARARTVGAPVMHIVHQGRAGGAFDPGGPGGKIIDVVAAMDGETIIRKTLPNAFAGTDLHDQLQKANAKNLIVAGFMTHMCVSSTVRAATDLGYSTTVAADAAASRDLPNPLGGVIDANTIHNAALAALADRFAAIAPVSKIVD